MERSDIVDFMLKRSSPSEKSRQKLVFFLVPGGARRTFVGTESNGISHSDTLDHVESDGSVDLKPKGPSRGEKSQKNSCFSSSREECAELYVARNSMKFHILALYIVWKERVDL